jgi:hypothetical protein
MIRNFAANLVYGREFPTNGTCVCHGRAVYYSDFRDDLSRKEYIISRLCQEGQDTVFGGDDHRDDED